MDSKQKLKELIRLFNALEKVDKNALENLQKLVKMAESNPGKYKLALTFL